MHTNSYTGPRLNKIKNITGRDGPADVIEYQTCVLAQVYQNVRFITSGIKATN